MAKLQLCAYLIPLFIAHLQGPDIYAPQTDVAVTGLIWLYVSKTEAARVASSGHKSISGVSGHPSLRHSYASSSLPSGLAPCTGQGLMMQWEDKDSRNASTYSPNGYVVLRKYCKAEVLLKKKSKASPYRIQRHMAQGESAQEGICFQRSQVSHPTGLCLFTGHMSLTSSCCLITFRSQKAPSFEFATGHPAAPHHVQAELLLLLSYLLSVPR